MRYKFFKRYIDKKKRYVNFVNCIFFEQNYWNDYGFETTFESYKVRKDGKLLKLGSVNIAKLTAKLNEEGIYRTFDEEILSGELSALPEDFVFLGSTDFYLRLHANYNYDECKNILMDLQDICYDFTQKKDGNIFSNEVITSSFFRGYTKEDAIELIEYTYKELAKEGKRDGYNITYRYKLSGEVFEEIKFTSDTESLFPQNVHAIIGNNGVGKTRFLKDILSLAIRKELSTESQFKKDGDKLNVAFSSRDKIKINSPSDYFSKVIFISFSPFDKLYSRTGESIEKGNVKYLGLYKKGADALSLDNFRVIFEENIDKIFENKNDLEFFEDILKDLGIFIDISSLFKEGNTKFEDDILKKDLLDYFEKASAGQKIILLSLSTLIVDVKKYSLVLIDEPELFLHPPMISDYIRIISKIMSKKNGLCILTTHSPIIIQELPKSCVKIMSVNNETIFKVTEPEYETMGENLSTLTNTIFELNQYKSGFYLLIKDIVSNPEKYKLDWEDIDNLELGRDGMLYKELLMFEKREGDD